MATRLNPYLRFHDTAREAMELYHSVFGGELYTSTFEEFGMREDPAEKDKIMHAVLEAPGGLVIMAADTPSSMEYAGPGGHAISLSGDSSDEAELRGYWEKLSDRGEVSVPLEKAPWGDTFGMCTDRYGVSWMVNIAAAGR